MEAESSSGPPTVVGAVFPDRAAAATAAAALGRQGLTERSTTTAVWSGERYVIESQAGRYMLRGLNTGAAIGIVLGVVVGTLVTILARPSTSFLLALVVGGGALAALGAVLGGYFGIARYRPQWSAENRWSHLRLDPGEVLLVVSVDEEPEAAAATLARHGGRHVEPRHSD